jgi:CheY-like chemotaxis protein
MLGSELAGQRILLVEDSAVIAFDIAASLVRLGADIVGPAASVGAAWGLLSTPIHGAVLDYRLVRETSASVARHLMERNTPILLMTTHSRRGVASEFAGVPVIEKPFTTSDLENAALRVFGHRAAAHTPIPAPLRRRMPRR